MWKLLSRYRKALRYLVAGVLVALLEYGVFLLLQYGFSVVIWASQTISFLIGLVAAFLVHVLWTFKAEGAMQHKKHRFVLYCLLAGINVVITSIFITGLQAVAVPAWIAKVIVMGAVVVWNFALLDRIIFSDSVDRLLSKWRSKRQKRSKGACQ